MAKPNYQQAKRHKELARKARQERKLRRKSERTTSISEDAEQDATPASPPDGLPPSSASDG